MQYPDYLTHREMEVIGFVMRGLPAKLISSSMGITANTLNSHLRSIHFKTETHNMREVFIYGVHIGFDIKGVYTPMEA